MQLCEAQGPPRSPLLEQKIAPPPYPVAAIGIARLTPAPPRSRNYRGLSMMSSDTGRDFFSSIVSTIDEISRKD